MYIPLLVGLGGFIGAIMRYAVGGWIQNSVVSFPLGTFGVNVLGSYLLALVMYLSEYTGMVNAEVRVFFGIGMLGAFTTMSTFSYESFRLLERHELLLFSANVIGTLVFTMAAVYLGRLTVMHYWR
ncbi:fluoride efflux transporter CrcB [Candidatus Woesearchaeota archaeon CG_4_10_14_0_2_um_filter_57_5]|nr:MAG: chromosome condensation protein CrcB [Candidatus Woesearchaeota archaeon CG1_02_57_44]PIN71017.1 MAG: fluoride efflux transporter CrcB [Candidatus Woesearchaeota archaeon CG11_big_fil_rev_8_21_14_0_20_57_5]PIZ53894.1 MAG: fluoride efflux transporter CrcB [Candidatus Woesearchaeota archaeon CG_4_10_14_0_2_um_filter_57_5]